MRLEACNCIPSHPLFTPLQFRIVCHRIQLRERLFRLLLIAESSPSSHTACLSSQTMRLPSQAHGLGLQIIASHCNKHLPIACRCFTSLQALSPLRIIVSHCDDLPIIASHCKKHLSNHGSYLTSHQLSHLSCAITSFCALSFCLSLRDSDSSCKFRSHSPIVTLPSHHPSVPHSRSPSPPHRM